MVNPMKGEAIARTSAGEYTLAFTLGAMIAIEQECGRGFQDVLADMQAKQDVGLMLTVLWAGLKKHHNMTRDEVADIVAVAEMSVWAEAMARAINDPDAPKESGDARPRKAKAG